MSSNNLFTQNILKSSTQENIFIPYTETNEKKENTQKIQIEFLTNIMNYIDKIRDNPLIIQKLNYIMRTNSLTDNDKKMMENMIDNGISDEIATLVVVFSSIVSKI